LAARRRSSPDQLGAGQKEASQRTCVSILGHLAEFREDPWSDSLLRVCVLPPLAAGDSRRLLALAEHQVQKERSAINLFSLGAARYRAGQFEQAVASLEEAIQRRRIKEWGEAWLFLALAQKRLGKNQEAGQGLEKAINFLDKQPGRNWRLEIYLRTLRKEAEELIRGEKAK
jgi:tetratricopeptide (TPR) repeat protein